MKRYFIIFWFLVLAANLPLQAEEFGNIFENQVISVSFYATAGRIKGDTTYHITFPGGASELEFPLNSSLTGIKVELISKVPDKDKQPRNRFSVSWLTNSSQNTGDMKDFDWIDDDVAFFTESGLSGGYNQPGLDIYSESDAELTALIFDLQYGYNFFLKRR
ncbi:MAG: hypothetical protein AAB019_05910 [Planctomycetota bacterium]